MKCPSGSRCVRIPCCSTQAYSVLLTAWRSSFFHSGALSRSPSGWQTFNSHSIGPYFVSNIFWWILTEWCVSRAGHCFPRFWVCRFRVQKFQILMFFAEFQLNRLWGGKGVTQRTAVCKLINTNKRLDGYRQDFSQSREGSWFILKLQLLCYGSLRQSNSLISTKNLSYLVIFQED